MRSIVRLLDDQRRRQREDVAGEAHHHAGLEALDVHFQSAPADRACARLELDAADQAEIADVDHVPRALERMQRRLELRRHRGGAREQLFVDVELLRGQQGGTGERVRRVRVTVQELDLAFGSGLHDRFVDLVFRDHRAHRHRGVVDRLGAGQQVRRDVEQMRGKRRTEAAETGDDLVEDQQHAVLAAYGGNALEITLRRDQHTGGSRHRLDDHRGHIARIVEQHEAFELIGELRAVRRLPARVGVARQIVRRPDVVNAGHHRRKRFAVAWNPAGHRATDIDAVIAALAADDDASARLAACTMVGERHLDRGIRRLGTGVGEENPLHASGGDSGDRGRRLERQRVRHAERRRVIHRRCLLLHRLDDRPARMAGIDAPQAGGAVEHLAAVRCPVVHALSAGQQPRGRLESAVCSERHPEVFERSCVHRRVLEFHRALLWQRAKRSEEGVERLGADATVAAQCHQLKESIIDDEEAGRKRGRTPVGGAPLRLHRLPLHEAMR